MSDDPGEVVARYFDRMRECDIRVTELFHDDATLIGLGTLTRGRAEIDAFYRKVIERAGPSPRLAGPLMVNAGRVAAEIYIDLGPGVIIHVIDLFEVEDGLIRRLTYFLAQHRQKKEGGPI